MYFFIVSYQKKRKRQRKLGCLHVICVFLVHICGSNGRMWTLTQHSVSLNNAPLGDMAANALV